MNRDAWLAALTPGDEVIVSTSDPFIQDRLGTLKRKTPSGRLVVGCGGQEIRFNGRGEERARGWHYNRIEEPTPALREEIERGELAVRLKRVEWEKLPLETLRAASRLLAGFSGEGDEEG